MSQAEIVMNDSDDLLTAPASYAQQRVWLSQQVEGGAARYNVQAGLRFLGHLDRLALDEALTELVRRQSALRTSLAMQDGEVMQMITPPGPVVPRLDDISTLPDPAAELERRAQAEVVRPFDEADGPPLRFVLFRLAVDDHVLLMTMDHLMADPWSAGILHEELARAYGSRLGNADRIPEPDIQYADYAMWQHDLLAAGDLDDQVGYWREQLGDELPRLALPTTGRRKSRTAASVVRPLPADLMARLADFGRTTGSSLFMSLFTGYAALLGRYAGQDDVLIGTLTSGRTRPEIEGLVGFFANVAVLRVDLSGQPSFRELLSRVRTTTLNAYANQDVPFQHVVNELQPSRTGSEQPFFDTLMQLADMRRAPVELPGLRIETFRAASQPTPVDLAVTVMLENDRTVAVCEYDTGLFAEDTVGRMLDHYVLLLEWMTAHPDGSIAEPELLTAAERRWLAERANPRPPVPDDWTVASWFARTVARFPDRAAVDTGELRVTYAELDARADRVAHELRERGVGPETLVGILLERGLDLVTCVLGIIKAGGAYIPLDPAYPPDRLKYMIDDARPAWIISRAPFDKVITGVSKRILIEDLTVSLPVPSGRRVEPLPRPSVVADNLAYVIYTSGSTGRPKGAAVCHRGLALLAEALREVFELTPEDRVMQLASPSFDASVWEMLWAFGVGAALCVPSAREISHGDIGDLIRDHRATALITPPAVLSAIGDDVELPHLRTVVAGGEACTPQVAARWSRGRRFFNAYGPTEASVWSTVYVATSVDSDAETLPIGRPIGDVAVEVLDRHGRRAAVGTPGELHLGGETVGRGYLRRPAPTAEKYVPDPFSRVPGARLYRTGDLVRWRRDGTLEFLGRIDRQVKLRGFRIELGEIESRLGAHPAVRDTLVVLREDTPGHPVLTGYVVAAGGRAAVGADELRRHCAVTLPAHMVPAAIVVLDRFPLTPNGKIDRRALPIPEALFEDEEYVAPRSPIEEQLAGVWRDILGIERVSAYADFFDLGGDSLAATRVIARIRRDLGMSVPTQVLFDKRTLAEFAAAVEEQRAADA